MPIDDHYSPAEDPSHGTLDSWNEDHCSNSRCFLPKGHEGPCSDQLNLPRFRPQRRQIYAECTVNCDCVFADNHAGHCVDKTDQSINLCIECDDDEGDTTHTPEVFSIFADEVTHQVLKADLERIFDLPVPRKFEEAIEGPLAGRWKQSMCDEIEALMRNGTWVYVSRNDPRLRNRKITKSRWVYDIKYNRDGTIKRLKSRFVVCGYSQREGVDYERAFSATMRATSFRTVLSDRVATTNQKMPPKGKKRKKNDIESIHAKKQMIYDPMCIMSFS